MAMIQESLTAAERRMIARELEAEIRRRGTVEKRNEWEVHQAMVKLTVHLAEMMTGEADGAHFPTDAIATAMPILLVSGPDQGKVKRIVHEASHELMREWVAPSLYHTDAVICTHQDNPRVREQIAREVEEQWH